MWQLKWNNVETRWQPAKFKIPNIIKIRICRIIKETCCHFLSCEEQIVPGLVLLVTSIPHICHGLTDGVRGEKISHVENFQITVHDRCGEV